MKTLTDEAMDEIRAGRAIVCGAIEILSDPPIRIWGGYGVLTIDGEEYQPLGDRGVAQISGGALGGTAQSIDLSLSGIEPEAIEVLDADEVNRAPVSLFRLIFSGDGQRLLDYHRYSRGRLDPLSVKDIIGSTATISTSIETAARGLGRRGGRMRTDADQRLILSTDGFFKHVAYAGQKTLYWGGKPAVTAGVALSSAAASYGGIRADVLREAAESR